MTHVVFGLLNVHKPVGPTSHDIVAAVRRGTGIRRVGHGGTLDPLAEGVLVLALGQATRLLEYASGHDKTYEATVRLGIETDTYDAEGTILSEKPVPSGLDAADMETVLEGFRGNIQQVPPVYSALKVDGKAAYERARAGETVEIAPRRVFIHELNLAAYEPPHVSLYIHCSSGTYVRSLAHDIGQAVGCGAHLGKLRRVASGRFLLSDAVLWKDLVQAFADGSWTKYLISPDDILSEAPALHLDYAEAERISNGLPIEKRPVSAGLGRAYDPAGRFVAVLEGRVAEGVWHPCKVFTHLYQ